jgi:uncharacterized membrane protein
MSYILAHSTLDDVRVIRLVTARLIQNYPDSVFVLDAFVGWIT